MHCFDCNFEVYCTLLSNIQSVKEKRKKTGRIALSIFVKMKDVDDANDRTNDIGMECQTIFL